MSIKDRLIKSVSFKVYNPTYPYSGKTVEIFYNKQDLRSELIVDQDIKKIFNTHDDYIIDNDTIKYVYHEDSKLTLQDWIDTGLFE